MTKDEATQYLNSLNYSGFVDLFNAYKNYLLDERFEPSIIYPQSKDSITVFEIRCNEEISFNDVSRNNDLLFVVEVIDDERSTVLHKFDCTTDPCYKKANIAHSARQIYRGNVGLHHGVSGRECIRSDFGGGTWVRRTNSAGEVINLNTKHYAAELGHYGINIHDNGGFFNSSLGCTILAGGSYLQAGQYRDEYRPLLLKASNKNNIPISLIDLDDMDDLKAGKSDLLKADGGNDIETPVSPEPDKAIDIS